MTTTDHSRIASTYEVEARSTLNRRVRVCACPVYKAIDPGPAIFALYEYTDYGRTYATRTTALYGPDASGDFRLRDQLDTNSIWSSDFDTTYKITKDKADDVLRLMLIMLGDEEAVQGMAHPEKACLIDFEHILYSVA